MSSAIPSLARPELLSWARRRANLEVVAAERKIDLADGTIVLWESGQVAPTVAELRRAARVYRRPIAVFYLPAPPEDFETLRDYRRLAGTAHSVWSVALDAEHRRASFQREVLVEINEIDGVDPATKWRLEGLPVGNEDIAHLARTTLHAVAPRREPSETGTEFEHLNFWTAAVEASGVMVMTTERGGVEVSEMRGFSLYHDSIPVIVLNGADGARGRLFSLLHEFAHLVLRTSGICDTRTDQHADTAARRLEARCNAIAAATLMPREVVLEAPVVVEHDRAAVWSIGELIEAARLFGVSVEALLRRLVTIGSATADEYVDFRANTELPAKPKATGGDFYVTKSRDLGRGYVRAVVSARQRGLLGTYEAATYLGVRASQIDRLAKASRL